VAPTLVVELVGDEEARSAVKAVLLAIKEPSIKILESVRGLSAAETAATPVNVVMAVLDAAGEVDLSALRARARDIHTPLIAVLSEKSPTAMRKALREGADELLFLPLENEYITRSLLNLSKTRSAGQSETSAVVCSLVSNTGGVGLTTLAGNLGLALRSKTKRRVAFLDLHLQTAGLAVFLDLTPAHSIVTLGQTSRKLDSTALDATLTAHPSGAYLLAAPRLIEQSELITEDLVNSVLEAMRKLFDFVLVDCGSYVDVKTVAVWERSDHVFYVVDQSIKAVRSAGRFLDLVTRLDSHDFEPELIINKYRSDYPIAEEDITESLKKPVFAKIPYDLEALDQAQLAGESLWQVAPDSSIAKAIDELARHLSGDTEPAPAHARERFIAKLLPGKWRPLSMSLS